MTDSSLLAFLNAPVLVGDPEGRVVYLNPAFESRFQTSADAVRGEPLAGLFAGGGREAILRAVAEVCGKGESLRFRLREGEAGFLGLASPIETEHDRVGVIILLTDEPVADGRLLAFHREVHDAVEEAQHALEGVAAKHEAAPIRNELEDALTSVVRARKWSDELQVMLSGGEPRAAAGATLDPVRVLHAAVARVEKEFEQARAPLSVVLPSLLPRTVGDAKLLESALVRLLRHRLVCCPPGTSFTLAGRTAASDTHVLVSLADIPPEGSTSPSDAYWSEPPRDVAPRVVLDAVSALGGDLRSVAEAGIGRATLIALETCPAPLQTE